MLGWSATKSRKKPIKIIYEKIIHLENQEKDLYFEKLLAETKSSMFFF